MTDQRLSLLVGKQVGPLLWRVWFASGLGLVALVVYLSLADIYLPVITSTFGDKINHFIAYGALMGWFGQLYQTIRKRLIIAIILLFLGVVLEFAQGATGYRYLDWVDAVANSFGVLIGLLVLQMGAGNILLMINRWVLDNRKH